MHKYIPLLVPQVPGCPRLNLPGFVLVAMRAEGCRISFTMLCLREVCFSPPLKQYERMTVQTQSLQMSGLSGHATVMAAYKDAMQGRHAFCLEPCAVFPLERSGMFCPASDAYMEHHRSIMEHHASSWNHVKP